MKRRVLVVDDESGFRDMLEWNLREDDVQVDTASDGRQAQAMMSQASYALVITDISMPRLDGINLLKAMRTSHPGIPVIVMTGFGTVETAVEVMKLGALDFVLKPFDLQAMVSRVRGAMGLPEKAVSKGKD